MNQPIIHFSWVTLVFAGSRAFFVQPAVTRKDAKNLFSSLDPDPPHSAANGDCFASFQIDYFASDAWPLHPLQ